MSRRLIALLAAFVFAGSAVACADNAEDHAEEAADELREGDVEDAREETEEAQQDLQQGDTTELIN